MCRVPFVAVGPKGSRDVVLKDSKGMKKQNTNYINEQGKKGKPDQIGGSMGNWCFPMFQTGFRLVSDPSQVSVVNF
jgi:hypothetical protein